MEVGVATLYLDPESSGWEALVECGVILTISMKPGLYRRVNIVLGTEIKTIVKTDGVGLMLTKDNDITFICQRMLQHQRLRHRHTTLNDTIMSFATAFFDSDSTTVVLTKDYINCERNYFIIFDDDCLVYAYPRQRSTMLPTLKWIYEMAPPSSSLPRRIL